MYFLDVNHLEHHWIKMSPFLIFCYIIINAFNFIDVMDVLAGGYLINVFVVIGTISQRAKEMGIRKVLGANLLALWSLISLHFVKLLAISLTIAFLVTYYFMANWLQNYRYRTGVPLWLFLASGLGVISITLITVSFQSIKATLVNPVKSLRSE